MANAKIETAGGTKIVIDGTANEIAAIIDAVKREEKALGYEKVHSERKSSRKAASSSSLVGLILQLREEGFFNKPRKVIDVKTALDQKAHIYPFTSISTGLIRKVKGGQLGRVKEGSAWAYVKR